MDIEAIITIVLAAITTFFGGTWLIVKTKLRQAINLAKEAVDVATTLESALEDDKITKDEIANIKLQLSEVKGAFRKLFEKVEKD